MKATKRYVVALCLLTPISFPDLKTRLKVCGLLTTAINRAEYEHVGHFSAKMPHAAVYTRNFHEHTNVARTVQRTDNQSAST
jgi:hypothetical protein